MAANGQSGGQRPLFVPLRAEFFDAFASSSKRTEYRIAGGRWNAWTCGIGREVILSRGYGKHARLRGTVVGFEVRSDVARLPGWKVCYWLRSGMRAACIHIQVRGAVFRG